MAQIRDLLVAGKARFLGSGTFSGLLDTTGGLKISGAKALTSNPTFLYAMDPTTSEVVYVNTLDVTVGTAQTLGTQTKGATNQPIYLNNGVPTTISGTIGGTASPVYINSGVITKLSSTIGNNAKPVYLSEGTITAFTSTIGSASRPVYVNNGTLTNVNVIDIAYGGTGANNQVKNRVVITDSDSHLVTATSNHYASGSAIYINSGDDAPLGNESLYVKGSAQVDGHLSLISVDKGAKFMYNSSDKCVDIIFV